MSTLNLGRARGWLLAGASVAALGGAGHAFAQDAAASSEAAVEEVVVTGTRLVSNVNSPTPLTVVSTAELAQTTPSNIPDALNKLPVFQGSQQPRRSGDGNGNGAQNVLSLRGFGAQRTLVLLDGHRVTPTNAAGTTDTNVLPQMLVQRVDIVTGGASAVYGSDAVTGVVNFILDKKFTGVRVDANAGISTYGDYPSYKIGVAGGTSILGGRGHLLGSFQHRQNGAVDNLDRPYGDEIWVRTGSGTAANPYRNTKNTRRADSTFGGMVNACTATCGALNYHFISDGVLSLFNPGTKTGTSGQNQGGDGAYSIWTTALVKGRTEDAFGRFSYDLTDDISFYVQGSYAESITSGVHFPVKLTPGSSQASTFYKNNPFLTPAVRAQLGDNGRSDSSNTFNLGSYFVNLGKEGTTGARNANFYRNIMTGLDGVLGDYQWNVFYSHGKNFGKIESLNNSDYQKQFAALDAVVVNGTVQCYAATQAATAAAYAGCVPMNPFGPTALTRSAFDWFTDTTRMDIINTMDNVGGSFAGDAFENWAGPVSFAISGEARWNTYEVDSTADPTQNVDCTGLRICNSSLPRWAQPVSGDIKAKSNVWEVAGELAIPLLRDVPLFQSLDTNLAARYTDYSTSGSVWTWKAGLDWSINDDVRLRGTRSRDIRAPTLDDLYRPVQGAVSGFTDLHTSMSQTAFTYSQGNPNLKPEVARTWTGGVVLTPRFLPGFSGSIDYYNIRMDNAIGQVSAGNNTVQALCEESGGTHEYCSLLERPLPFSDRSPANFPTRAYSLNLNTALRMVEGVDFEASYRFDALKGNWMVRVLGNYQPTDKSQAFEGAPVTRNAGSETRITSMVRYQTGDWTFSVQDRWLSKFDLRTTPSQVYEDPWVPSFNTVDMSVDWRVRVGRADVNAYATVENVFNALAPINPPTGSIGLVYPVTAGQDILGRYFTVGFRSRF